MDPEPSTLHDSQDFCVETKRKELRTNAGYHWSPSAQESSHCVPARGDRLNPKHWGWGLGVPGPPSPSAFPSAG